MSSHDDVEGLLKKRTIPEEPASDNPFERMKHVVDKLTVQHEADREVYKREKMGLDLTEGEKKQVERYRDTRRRLRQAKRGRVGPSLSMKLDFIMYAIFAVALYYALWYDHKIDLLPHIFKFFAPNFDHLDDDGNWITGDPDEL